ncbi:MAG: tetratricopeptide repeat protein [Bacteroidaceae bacterium]
MITHKQYYTDYKKTLALLKQGHLKAALDLQKQQISDLQEYALMDECIKIEEAYDLMIRYFSEGVEDKRRKEVYESLRGRVLVLAEKVKRCKGIKDAVSIYYYKVKTVGRQSRTLGYYTRRLQTLYQQHLFATITEDDNTSTDNVHNELVEELFDYIWVAAALSEEDGTVLGKMFEEDYLSDAEKQWLVSALTLSLLYYYDEKKLDLLVSLIDHSHDRTACRALVGLSLVVYEHRDIFEIRAPHELFDFRPELSTTWAMLQIFYFTLSNTKRIRMQIEQDFMPLMMNLHESVNPQKLQELLEDEEVDLPPGVDPDIIHRIRKGMMSISEKAESGVDMYFYAFSKMKTGPFFNEVRNWLKPFPLNNLGERHFLNMMDDTVKGQLVCDSDKYSMADIWNTLPAAFRKEVNMFSVNATISRRYDIGRMAEDALMDKFFDLVKSFNFSLNLHHCLAFALLYMQDLYRLFMLKLNHETEGNPFAEGDDIFILDIALVCPRIESKDLSIVAMEAYEQHQYAKAVRLFDLLARKRELKKKEELICAFCCSMKHDYENAIEHFEKVLKMGGVVSDELLSVYAVCYANVGKIEKTVEIYAEMYKNESPALSLYRYAVALSRCGKYGEAREVLFKEDFLNPGNLKTERLLVWCLLREGDKEKALKYSEKLLHNAEVGKMDFFNAGHAYFAMGRNAEAIDCYRKTMGEEDAKFSFSEEDRDLLRSLGVKEMSINIMEDAV